MTRRDEVIRIARSTGWDLGWEMTVEQVCEFAALVAAAERERCAKVCEERGNRMRAAAGHPNGDRDEFYCADDIRALNDEVGE